MPKKNKSTTKEKEEPEEDMEIPEDVAETELEPEPEQHHVADDDDQIEPVVESAVGMVSGSTRPRLDVMLSFLSGPSSVAPATVVVETVAPATVFGPF